MEQNNEHDGNSRALIILKPTKKSKKRKARGRDKQKRAAYGSKTKNGQPTVNNNNQSNEPIISNSAANATAQNNQSDSTEGKTGIVTVEEVIKKYESKLDGDTIKESDKNKNEIPKIEDYTGENIDDGEGNTTGNKKSTGPQEATLDDRYTGEELIRFCEGLTSLVNPFIVRAITKGRKRPKRADFLYTAADKKLLSKSADKIADQIIGEATPMQQFFAAMAVVNLGVLSDHIDINDITSLFKKKPKTEDHTKKPSM